MILLEQKFIDFLGLNSEFSDCLQDFLNMFFRDVYRPIPLVYNLVLAMLWRHPENVELDKVKVVHYCAAVNHLFPVFKKIWV